MGRIGVYICECGPNIKDRLDVGQLVRYAVGLENVTLAKPFGILCSEEGKALIAKEIKSRRLTRVIIAGCSPKEHEKTFRNVLRDAGLNPFLLQMANIREQCAWVHKDYKSATEKAKAIINAAVKRVFLHEALPMREMDCRPDVLVVGAGISGISATLALAGENRKVYLVEKEPFIGGKAVQYETVLPNLECAACLLEPLLDAVLHKEQIEVLTVSQVINVLGFYGNFIIEVESSPRYVDETACIGCKTCMDACPVTISNEYNLGLDERKAITIPFDGALPNTPVIDESHCLRFKGKTCEACRQACPFDAIKYDQKKNRREINVGACVIATGFDLFDPH